MLKLNIVRTRIDPHFGFTIDSDHEAEVYKRLFNKGYKCLEKYQGSKSSITVECPKGHKWSGYPKKVSIPCNNCPECWKEDKITPAQKIAKIIQARNGIQIDPYSKKDNKISIICEQGDHFDITPGDIQNGRWCNICAGNNPEETKKKFYQVLQDKGAEATGPYINSKTKIEIVCKNGHKHYQIPTSTIIGYGCYKCYGNTKESGKQKLIQALFEKEANLVSPYVNANTKVRIECSQGHIFEVIPYSVTSGHSWCSRCAGHSIEQARERFNTKVIEMNGTALSSYINNQSKVKIQCKENHIFFMSPNCVSRGHWCPVCKGCCPVASRKKFEDKVSKRNGKIVGDYINNEVKVNIQCDKGHTFSIRPYSIMAGQWCRFCGLSQSKGERLIQEYLTDNNIQHIPEKTFPWAENKKYDFYFPYKDKHFLVEFDGIQHFQYNDFFHRTQEEFNKRRQIDIDKTIWALNNGYFLIRIAYSDIDNISEILEPNLNNPQSQLMMSSVEEYDWLLAGIAGKLK